MELPPYGGLSKIIFTSNGLTFFYLKQPIDRKKQVVLEAQVTIAINENNLISVNCLKCDLGPYKLEIEIISKDYMIISCENENPYHMKRFIPPICPSDNILKPGIFMGDYGGHGVEFVSLEYDYDYDSHEINIRKLTGDPNVPAGEISINVYLEHPMILDEGQQYSIYILLEMNSATPCLPPGMTIHTMPKQPFIVPIDCHHRDELISRSFQHCKSRFHSDGQIAQHGFINPSFIPGHFIIFDEDTFGHIFLPLRLLSMFKRVENI